jgi:hypothetical protein
MQETSHPSFPWILGREPKNHSALKNQKRLSLTGENCGGSYFRVMSLKKITTLKYLVIEFMAFPYKFQNLKTSVVAALEEQTKTIEAETLSR